MPFALKECPAFGLTQIKDDLTLHLAGSVHCDLLYLNHAFYQIAGEDIFRFVNGDFYGYYRFEDNYHYMIEEHQKSGLDVEYNGAELGNWIFSKKKKMIQRIICNNTSRILLICKRLYAG